MIALDRPASARRLRWALAAAVGAVLVTTWMVLRSSTRVESAAAAADAPLEVGDEAAGRSRPDSATGREALDVGALEPVLVADPLAPCELVVATLDSRDRSPLSGIAFEV